MKLIIYSDNPDIKPVILEHLKPIGGDDRELELAQYRRTVTTGFESVYMVPVDDLNYPSPLLFQFLLDFEMSENEEKLRSILDEKTIRLLGELGKWTTVERRQ